MQIVIKESWSGFTNIRKKIVFKTKIVIREKRGHCMMIKVSIQQEDITVINNTYT